MAKKNYNVHGRACILYVSKRMERSILELDVLCVCVCACELFQSTVP